MEIKTILITIGIIIMGFVIWKITSLNFKKITISIIIISLIFYLTYRFLIKEYPINQGE